jgi:CYTH domain
MQSDHTQKTETETHDIYLVPPGEDTESCQSWIRMRNRDGRYNLMFEEWVTDGPFIISPRITFEVLEPHSQLLLPAVSCTVIVFTSASWSQTTIRCTVSFHCR